MLKPAVPTRSQVVGFGSTRLGSGGGGYSSWVSQFAPALQDPGQSLPQSRPSGILFVLAERSSRKRWKASLLRKASTSLSKSSASAMQNSLPSGVTSNTGSRRAILMTPSKSNFSFFESMVFIALLLCPGSRSRISNRRGEVCETGVLPLRAASITGRLNTNATPGRAAPTRRSLRLRSESAR